MLEDVYHEGELKVQEIVGEREIAIRNGRVISNELLAGMVKFIEKQSYLVVSSIDDRGELWISIILGENGFVSTSENTRLAIDLNKAILNSNEPLLKNIKTDHRVGLLFIELSSRRRLRINGSVERGSEKNLLVINIEEAYPNCPQYIQRRLAPTLRINPNMISSYERFGKSLEIAHLELIERSDTFFIASIHKERGLDASHRGGNPGFIKILSDGRLAVPDYSGNSMYNTLGNLVLDPRAAVLFIDFEKNMILQINGRVEINFHSNNEFELKNNTLREWYFTCESWRESTISSEASNWEFLDFSPSNPN